MTAMTGTPGSTGPAEPGDTARVTGAAVAADGLELTVRFADGTTSRYNRFWLRDNCPSNGPRASLFRPFSVASMSDDLTIVEAERHGDGVRVAFDDGVADVFPDAFLRAFSVPDHPSASRTTDEAASATPRDSPPVVFGFADVVPGEVSHLELLDAVDRHGFAIVSGVPATGTEHVASWLGPIRETDFGRVFDIITEPMPFTPSQSGAALDPHTDDPYRYSPAGISLLHCVVPCAGDGGATTIVDGFAVAEAIRAVDVEALRLLATVPVSFVHRRDESVEQGAAVHLRASAPIVSLDAAGRVCGIRFHERSMDTLRLDPDMADAYYRALMLFSTLVNGGRYCVERRLAAGEVVVFDNQRVLHGRSAITGGDVSRHLRLCTVDRDQVHSRLRQLRQRFVPGTEHLPLPSGSTTA